MLKRVAASPKIDDLSKKRIRSSYEFEKKYLCCIKMLRPVDAVIFIFKIERKVCPAMYSQNICRYSQNICRYFDIFIFELKFGLKKLKTEIY